MAQVELSVADALKAATISAYWDGYAACARATAQHAKEVMIKQLTASAAAARPQAVPKQEEPAA